MGTLRDTGVHFVLYADYDHTVEDLRGERENEARTS